MGSNLTTERALEAVDEKMEGHARRPDPLNDKGSMDKNWLSWKQDFLIFMKASGYMNESKERKAYMLMNLVGKVGMEALGNMIFESDEEKEDVDVLLMKFDEYFNPPKKEAEERYAFFTRSKKWNESIECYIEELKTLAKSCNFGDLTDSLIRDRIIVDIKDKILVKKLLNENDLDLAKLVIIYQIHEMDTEKMREMYKSNANSESSDPATQSSTSITWSYPPKKRVCWRCGKTHEMRNCPAWGKRCNTCNELCHYTHMCPTKKHERNQAGPFSQINKYVKDYSTSTSFRNETPKTPPPKLISINTSNATDYSTSASFRNETLNTPPPNPVTTYTSNATNDSTSASFRNETPNTPPPNLVPTNTSSATADLTSASFRNETPNTPRPNPVPTYTSNVQCNATSTRSSEIDHSRSVVNEPTSFPRNVPVVNRAPPLPRIQRRPVDNSSNCVIQ